MSSGTHLKTNDKDFVVYNLQNTYIDIGKYFFKVVLSKKFEDSKFSTIKIIDSDGKDIEFELNHWGRKMNIDFFIKNTTPDGVAAIDLTLKNDENTIVSHQRLFFWIVK